MIEISIIFSRNINIVLKYYSIHGRNKNKSGGKKMNGYKQISINDAFYIIAKKYVDENGFTSMAKFAEIAMRRYMEGGNDKQKH